jgi:fucose 4-O-acetylase-like acetyltransferase
LVALFDVSILFYGFYKSKIKIGYCVVIGSIGFLVGEVEKRYGFRLPWCFDIALVAFLFYAAGYYYRNFTYKLVARKDMKFIMGIFLGVIGILMGFINTNYMLNNNYTMTRVDMLYLNWGSIPLFLLSGITISVSLSLISTVIFTRYRFSILENIGQNSLLIMVIHLYIIQFLSRFGKNVKIPAKPWFIFLLGLFLSVVISKLIVRKCPWLIEYSMAKKVLNDLHDKKKRG